MVTLCREHRLHSALIYVFNKGLNDYVSPLEELLGLMMGDASLRAGGDLGDDIRCAAFVWLLAGAGRAKKGGGVVVVMASLVCLVWVCVCVEPCACLICLSSVASSGVKPAWMASSLCTSMRIYYL